MSKTRPNRADHFVASADAGFDLADQVVATHVATEELFLGRLSLSERDTLRELLAKIA